MSNSKSQKTMCIHSGQFHDSLTHGVLTPIFPSTSHAYLDLEKKAYPRYFNTPNQEVLAAKLAELEHGEAGILFASGMA
ncbi:MAG: cystathionine beta-lyase, partial [Calditrichaeota bacterium]